MALEEKIAKVAIKWYSIILMGDCNSKLGPEYVKNDPKTMSEIGTILAGIL